MIARGTVLRTSGELVIAALPGARVGDGVVLEPARAATISGIVAAIDRGRATIAPFATLRGVASGDAVRVADEALACVVGYGALGRAIDARGLPLDGGSPLRGLRRSIETLAPAPETRAPVERAIWTGVPAIDGLLAFGRGARVGIFGAPGCGKSTLLEAVARDVDCDAVVVALIGERGREAQTWLERCDARTTIVCATSDRSASERVRAAHLAMAHAAALRERGLDVLLIVDSLARFCAAERERRTALGEPVGRGGYPAAVWAELARYLECAGAAQRGSITLVASVLSDGGDEREPLSDNARSLLDGHVVLSPALARAGRFPAIDVLASASRTMQACVAPSHLAHARAVRAALATLAATEDARALGLGTDDPRTENARALETRIEAFLRRAACDAGTTLLELRTLARALA